jgi:UDP-N-acetylglucosamine 2-epimerase (non-hydrolysing)
MKLMIVLGTRPEIIKMASIIDACRKFNINYFLAHTEQHYDKNLSRIFFEELRIDPPKYTLAVGSGTHTVQTARALTRLEKVMLREKPDVVLVEGDTNTVLAGGLAAVKLGIPVGHVEAGLRSYDLRMPEEHNRRLVDHLSSYLFAPTEHARKILVEEHVWGKIYLTGNTVIDACLRNMPIAEEKSRIMENISFDTFALATVHRAENVDDKTVLTNLVRVFLKVNIPVVFPLHPRTLSRLKEAQLYNELTRSDNVKVLSPLGYFDFLLLMKNCEFIMTDSGGIQEEATSPNLKKMTFVLRRSTERPEAVEAGFAKVVGTELELVLYEIGKYIAKRDLIQKKLTQKESPYGDGKAGEHIVQIIKNSSF